MKTADARCWRNRAWIRSKHSSFPGHFVPDWPIDWYSSRLWYKMYRKLLLSLKGALRLSLKGVSCTNCTRAYWYINRLVIGGGWWCNRICHFHRHSSSVLYREMKCTTLLHHHHYCAQQKQQQQQQNNDNNDDSHATVFMIIVAQQARTTHHDGMSELLTVFVLYFVIWYHS